MLKRCLLMICLLLLARAGSAPVLASIRYAVDGPWTTDQGLPQNSVLTITQTRDGYLWLGTISGLVRFDGVRFTVFDESNTPQLGSGPVVRLFEDSLGNFWIGTEVGGVLRVNSAGKVTPLDIGRGSRETRLASVVEDASGSVWLCTAHGQLARCKDQQVDVWEVPSGSPSARRWLAADKSGTLWLGNDWGLAAFDPSKVSNDKRLPLSRETAIPGRLDFLLASARGGFWLLANGKVQKCALGAVEKDYGSYPWGRHLIVGAACEDTEGNLLVGTYGDPGDGVYRVSLSGGIEKLEGLSKLSILSLLLDRDGSVWVGTDGDGLKRLRPQYIQVVESTRDLTVQSVSGDRSGGVLLGINGGGVHLVRAGEVREFSEREGLSNPYVRSVLVDREDRVWAGTYGGGLFQLRDGRFVATPGFEAMNPQVSALYQDKRGTLWAGTQGGLARWDGQSWRTFSDLDGLSGNAVQAIAEDSEGGLWAGTAGSGLNRIVDGKVTRYFKTNGLPSDNISALYFDRDSTLWVGTSSAGLARRKGEAWANITAAHGLAGNSIRYLIEDREDSLWIGSNGGLMRVPKRSLNALADGRTNAIPIRIFQKADGLPASECSPGSQPAAYCGQDGRLWFTTIRGLAMIDPAALQKNTNAPSVVIAAVYVDRTLQGDGGLRAPVPRTVTVPARKEGLEIHFACLNLSAPGKGRFEYRLGNHETAWTSGEGNSGVARYTRLPHGSYQFQVRACNEDGVWSSRGAELAITVLPPFWRTWWFLSLCGLALLGLVAGSVYYIATQKLQRQLASMRQKEALENERARIARDLHDQLGANLTQVALLGEMAEEDKNLPGEVESHARQICGTARETTRALDEIVWTVNPSNDTVEGLVNYLCKYAQEYFAMAGLKYRLEVPPELPATPISPELRHNVFLAAKEAVNNVVKHARATSAWLRFALQPGRLVVEVEDDGRGLSAGYEAKGRNGLKNMRRRMEDVGGEFTAVARQPGGTLVRLSAPLEGAALVASNETKTSAA